MPDPVAKRRRSFGPVVLLGLASAGLVAIGGNRPAAVASGERARAAATTGFVTYDAHLPAATAFALVVLACWGVILVSRGRSRRIVAALGVLAAAAMIAAVVVGFGSVPDELRRGYAEVGEPDVGVHRTAWFWIVSLGALLSLATCALAVRLIPGWPEMGSRYDAPATGAGPTPVAGEPEEQSSLDLWKAMDDGRDPTA